MTKHAMYTSREYRAWQRMKTVCYNVNNRGYRTYGSRGVRVCQRWKESFRSFHEDMGDCPEGCTGIELINMSGDFERHNCRWVGPNKRRPLKDMPNQKNREAQKRYLQPKKIVITVEKKYFEFIQRQAIEKSRELGEPISAPELIKLVLQEQIPMPRQLDMFEKQRKKER